MIHTILVVEDEEGLREYLENILVEKGFSVKTAPDGIEAMNILKENPPDLLILDLGLPTMRGETVCVEAKKLYPELQIIILTAANDTQHIVKGLNLGADDYLGKPFETDELLARVNARLRIPSAHQVLKVGDLEMNTSTMDVTRGKKKITLTPQEFKLLEYLMTNAGKVLSRMMILNRLWLYSPDIDTRVVDVYIGYLRKKIDAGATKKLIHSVRGFGYTIKS